MSASTEHDDTGAAPAHPAMITNTQPHTVSLSPGSNVATRKSARKADGGGAATPVREKTVLRGAPAEPGAARAPAPKAPGRSVRKSEAATTAPPAAATEPLLGDEIVRRIAALQALNDDARAALDWLGGA